MSIPQINKPYIIVIFSCLSEHHPDLTPQKIETFLLSQSTLQQIVLTLMILLDQLLQNFLGFSVLLCQHFVAVLKLT